MDERTDGRTNGWTDGWKQKEERGWIDTSVVAVRVQRQGCLRFKLWRLSWYCGWFGGRLKKQRTGQQHRARGELETRSIGSGVCAVV